MASLATWLGERMRRHPLAMRAHFRRSLVVTWAYPQEVLRPLLPPGLEPHGYDGWGFLAVAVVAARALRPVGVPSWFGADVVLAGYRVFARLRRGGGRDLIGLRILRSDVDEPRVRRFGNRLTRYGFNAARATLAERGGELAIRVSTADGRADLDLTARLDEAPAPLPAESPFPRLSIARRFAGPLPNTFEHDPAAGAIVVVEGVRGGWRPHPVRVDVRRCGFLDDPRLAGARPRLANAFLVSDVPYRWKPGRLVRAA